MVEKVSGLIASVVWGLVALSGDGPFLLHHHRLLVFQNGTGPVDGHCAQIMEVLVLLDVCTLLREKKIQ